MSDRRAREHNKTCDLLLGTCDLELATWNLTRARQVDVHVAKEENLRHRFAPLVSSEATFIQREKAENNWAKVIEQLEKFNLQHFPKRK